MLRNTISESIVTCHIRIKLICLLRAVLSCCLKMLLLGGQALGYNLFFFAAGFGAASVAAFMLELRVIRCLSFLFGAASCFGSFA